MNDANPTDDRPESTRDFRLGELRVFPAAGRIEGPGGVEQVDPKVMAVFELLARHAGELVTRDMLLDSIWEGRVVSDDVVSRCIYHLRRHLARASGGRTGRGPVRTLPKRGYLLDALVQPLDAAGTGPPAPVHARPAGAGGGRRAAVLAALLLAAGLAWWTFERADPTGAPEPAAGPPGPPTVAVLPFVDLSPAADQAYLADGISEEIIGRLGSYRDLRVIGRTSSFALRDSGYGSRQISDLLGAPFLLEGSVRKDGDALRISAQLVDRDGVRVWGATFDRELRDVFAIQDEIARVVAASILPQVVPAVRVPRQPDIEAYREYLVGRDLLARRTGLFFDEAPAHFTRAIEIDPAFAEAYAARAVGLFFRSRTVGRHDAQIEQAWKDVETAIALDPELGQAYAARSLLMERTAPGDLHERERLLRRALELDPTLSDAWNWLSGLLFEQARIAEAEQALLEGARSDPLAPAINVNLALHEAARGRPAEGVRRLERLLQVPHPSPMVADGLVEILVGSGRYADALEVAKRLVLDASPDAGRAAWTFPLVLVYSRLGMRNPARYWLERHVAESPPPYFPVTLYVLHVARAALGYEDALARYRALLADAGIEPAQLPVERRANYGELLALTGDHAGALRTLDPVYEQLGDVRAFQPEIRLTHALAWALQQSGQAGRAAAMLQRSADQFAGQQSLGLLEFGDDLAAATLDALLRGDLGAARGYLERAVAAGWRDPHGIARDPRWDPARSDPVLRGLLDRAESDLERQRLAIEAVEDHDAFVAQVDAAIAAGRSRAKRP